MATGRTRKTRGYETQRLVASFLAENGWPWATDAGPGRSGDDVLNTPGLSIEVKARRGFNPLEWVRQTVARANGRLPLVVHRPDGLGPAHVSDWLVTLRLEDAVRLLRLAGYGDPIPEPPAPEEG